MQLPAIDVLGSCMATVLMVVTKAVAVEKAAMVSVKVEMVARAAASTTQMVREMCRRGESCRPSSFPPPPHRPSAAWPYVAALLHFWCVLQAVVRGLVKMLGVRTRPVGLAVLLAVVLDSAREVLGTRTRRPVVAFWRSLNWWQPSEWR